MLLSFSEATTQELKNNRVKLETSILRQGSFQSLLHSNTPLYMSLSTMNKDEQVSRSKRGKRRPLLAPKRRRSGAHLPWFISRSYVALFVVLLLSCHEANGSVNSNHGNPLSSQSLNQNEQSRRKLPGTARRRNANHHVPAPSPLKDRIRVLTEPGPAPQKDSIPEKPSLDYTASQAPERNDTRFSVDLSIAVVVESRNTSLSNDTTATEYYSDTLSTIVKSLDTIIVNDTDYELHSSFVTNNHTATTLNETQQAAGRQVPGSWVYTLKVNNVTAKEYENATACSIADSNETVTVTWVKVVVEYYIIPKRRAENDTAAAPAANTTNDNNGTGLQHGEVPTPDNKDSEDNVFENEDPWLANPTQTERSSSSSGQFSDDWDAIKPTVLNATRDRIEDGSILEWIQQIDLSVVGVAQVGLENSTQCLVVDMNPELNVPIPFIDPLDLKSWDALQMLGSIMFMLTLLGTSSLCVIGRNRSKALRIEHWSATIGDESAVNDLLTFSSRFLPPECINKRDANGATIVTIPGADSNEPCYPLPANETACHVSGREQCHQACRH